MEDHLISAKTDRTKLSKIIGQIRKNKALFDDVYLYLRIRKTMIA